MVEKQEQFTRLNFDIFPAPDSPNGKLLARHKANEEGFEALLAKDPKGYAGHWIAFADGIFLANVSGDAKVPEGQTVMEHFSQEYRLRAEELDIDIGAVYATFVP